MGAASKNNERLTIQEGDKTFERVFVGCIRTGTDMAKFIAELSAEMLANPGKPIFCEIWKEKKSGDGIRIAQSG